MDNRSLKHLRLVAFGASLLTLGACRNAPQSAKTREVAARRDVVAARALAPRHEPGWLGVILPRRSVDVATEIGGQAEQVRVREGDAIRRGEIVAVLDSAHDRQELAMAEVGLRAAGAEVARSRLDLADAETRLTSRIATPDAFPREEIRRAEIQKQMAAVHLEATEALAEEQRTRVAEARNRVAKAEIRAPADGTVTRRYLEPGALAAPGQPVVRIIGDGTLIVRFAAPPGDARSMRTAMRVNVAADDAIASAVIESVSSEIDPPSGMVILVAVLDSAARIKPGSVVRVHPA
jgi:RND family efflux transporter MFP subunit